jgi:hypothetical protein
MENHHAINGKTHYKSPFSIAISMFTRPGTSHSNGGNTHNPAAGLPNRCSLGSFHRQYSLESNVAKIIQESMFSKPFPRWRVATWPFSGRFLAVTNPHGWDLRTGAPECH